MDTLSRFRIAALSLLIVVMLLVTASAALAQQAPTPAITVAASGQLQELVLRDGTRAIGRVEKVDANRVTFRTEAGATLEVDVAQVVSVDVVHGRIVENTYWPEDSNPTRLFFAPTGRTLKKGESYFGLYEIYVPFVQYGVTDRFSIGGGTPLYLGGGEHPLWFTPKLQLIAKPTTQVSIGVMHFLNIDHASVGIAYSALTKGTTDSAATIGIGWAYDIGRDGGTSAVVMLGGEHRISRRMKFVTENYIIEGHGLISGGLRFMGDRLSADIGLLSPMDADEFFAFPMVNFVWKFTK
jgi:hypothetical protein